MSHTSWFHRQPTLLPGRAVDPVHVYRLRAAASGFFGWLAFALWALYTVRDAGLSPFQLIAAAVVLELTVVLCEIPTGVIADVLSRRLSVIIGTVISGLGWAVMGLAPSFEGILVGQFLWGLGFTFTSGASEAWLADEVGEDRAAMVYPQAAQWRQVARVTGVLAAAGLGLYGAGVPFVVGGLGYALFGVLLLFTMTEAGWRRLPSGEAHLAAARRTALAGLQQARRRPMVRAALMVAFLFGAASEVFESLWGYRLIRDIGLPDGVEPVLLFGGMAIATECVGLVVVTTGRRVSADGSRESAARVLAVLYVLRAVTAFAFVIAFGPLVAMALAVATRGTDGGESAFFTMWVNRGLDPHTRATVLSVVGQANSVGQVAQAPLFASVVALGGVQVALVLGALLVLPASLLVQTRAAPEREPERTTA